MKPIKTLVKEKYNRLVKENRPGSASRNSCCEESFQEDYSQINGYEPEADFGLGCGLPTVYAKLKIGQAVLDLGSGAGNDCFVARAEVGPTGRVYGLDFSEAMVSKAKENAARLGYDNVEFIVGDIEAIPLEKETVNVVVSNCVLNLIPNKEKVFSEIYRVLHPGGHFSISDVVATDALPKAMAADPVLFSDCIGGASPKETYLKAVKKAGFKNITIQKERELPLSESANQYQIPKSLKILSITLYAEK